MTDSLKNITCLAEALDWPAEMLAAGALWLLLPSLAAGVLVWLLLQRQQPTIMWGVMLSFYFNDESSRLSTYESPGEFDYEKLHSFHLTKQEAEDLCAKFNRFVQLLKENNKIDRSNVFLKLEYAQVIELEVGKRILPKGKEYDPLLDDLRNCGIEALWKKFLAEDCKDEPEQP